MKTIIAEFRECVTRRDVWLLLSLYDIRARYKRTVIGPFWLTLGTAITVLGMGVVWSSIFGMNITEFLPYVAVGMVIWTYLSSVLNEGCAAFSSQAGIIHNVKMSYFVYIMTLIFRNLVILLHNCFVIVAVFVLCGQTINLEVLWIIPGLILMILHSFWVCMIMGIVAARYRDIASIVGSITVLIMLVTPIMWKIDMLKGNRQLIALVNPFAHMINIIRDPLLGSPPSLESYIILTGLLFVGFSIACDLYRRCANFVVYWM